MTARQLARRTGLSFDACRDVVLSLAKQGFLCCLNDQARRSRLYWLTQRGKTCQRQLSDAQGMMLPPYSLPIMDWELYGWVCYSHRSIILKTLSESLQPADIKRKARARHPSLAMSAGNVRDVIHLFQERGLVRPLQHRKRKHLRYELTELGLRCQRLLTQAEELP